MDAVLGVLARGGLDTQRPGRVPCSTQPDHDQTAPCRAFGLLLSAPGCLTSLTGTTSAQEATPGSADAGQSRMGRDAGQSPHGNAAERAAALL